MMPEIIPDPEHWGNPPDPATVQAARIAELEAALMPFVRLSLMVGNRNDSTMVPCELIRAAAKALGKSE